MFKSNNGTNSPDNLIVLCKTCHEALHALVNAQEQSLKLKLKTQILTAHATQISTITAVLKKRIKTYKETYGYLTKYNREQLGLKKEHFLDALAISLNGENTLNSINNMTLFRKVCVSRGDYKQTKGGHSNIKIPTGKLFGYRKFDKIETKKGMGFVKGKRSSGSFSIMGISGNKISDGVNIRKNTARISARHAYIEDVQFIPNLKNWVSLGGEL